MWGYLSKSSRDWGLLQTGLGDIDLFVFVPITVRVGYLFYLYFFNICESICQKVPRMEPITDRVGWYLFCIRICLTFVRVFVKKFQGWSLLQTGSRVVSILYLYLFNICESICQKVPRMEPITDRVGWYWFYLYLCLLQTG